MTARFLYRSQGYPFIKKGLKLLILLALSSFMLTKTSKAMSNVQEIWRPAYQWEESYEVSNLGRMRSIDRSIIDKKGVRQSFKGKIIYQSLDTKGYLKVGLWRKNKVKSKKVHRFVAIAFIPNPENLPQVNHKDGNKLNANASNLEWATNQYNQVHSFTVLGRKQKSGYKHKQSIPVYQLSLDGFFISDYGSIEEAARETGICSETITNIARRKFKSFRSPYNWSF